MEKSMFEELRNIYSQMNNYLETYCYKYISEEEKKQVLERGLKTYLVNRIGTITPNVVVDNYTKINDLIEILATLKGISANEISKQLVDYLLYIMSNEQKHPIKWETSDSNHSSLPKIVSNENCITAILADNLLNYQDAFNYLNQYYMEEFKAKGSR